MRVVDRLVLHREPLSFRALLERLVPTETRFLVLDQDRTVHLGRNIGELLGWELALYQAHGMEGLDRLEDRRHGRGLVLDPAHPMRTMRALTDSALRWARPGLYYLLWGKLAWRHAWLRRRSFLRFGANPIREAQRWPQLTLLEHVAEASLPLQRTLTERILRRHAGEQVIEADDLRWLRSRCPGIEILIASASPRGAVEQVGAELGVDAITYSTREQINSGEAKIEGLRALRPAIFEPGVVSVGITDTGYGEDHCWAEHFTHLADINSDAPFAPIISSSSPLREIHSAAVLTREEKTRRAAGEPSYLDPRRRRRAGPASAPPSPLVLGAAELRSRLGGLLAELEALLCTGALSSGIAEASGEAAYRFERLLQEARALSVGAEPA